MSPANTQFVAPGTPEATAQRPPRLLVMLCTYNERQNLPDILSALRDTLPAAHYLVVDDNSPDGTGDWTAQQQAQHPDLHVLKRPGKFGLGSALRDGIRWCLEHEYDFLINLDADQSHDPRAITEVLAPSCLDPEKQLVTIGSRYVAGGDSSSLSPWRQRVSRWLNEYATRLLKLPIADCSGSYRCYPVRLLRQITLTELTCDGYGFLQEILVALAEAGARFREVPITYHARGSGSSKLSLSDALGAVAVIRRLSKRRR